MNNTKKLGLSIASFGAATLCLVGGTFAWYVVNNTGTATISGTTAKADGELTIGIKPHTIKGAYALTTLYGDNYAVDPSLPQQGNKVDLDDYVDGVTDPDTCEVDDIYWNYQDADHTKKGNQILANHLHEVYSHDGYTTLSADGRDFVAPVTSRSFTDKGLTLNGSEGKNEAIKIYDIPGKTSMPTVTGSYDSDTSIYDKPSGPASPEALQKYKDGISAIKEKYMSFTLVFNSNGIANQSIYLNNSMTQFIGGVGDKKSAYHEVVKTLRVSFESDYNNYIFSPASFEYNTIKTKVGGYLGLDALGVYDYYPITIKEGNKNQYIQEVADYASLPTGGDIDNTVVYYYDETAAEGGTVRHAYAWNPSTASLKEIDSSIVSKVKEPYQQYIHKWYGEHEALQVEGDKLTDKKYLVVLDNAAKDMAVPAIGSSSNPFIGIFAKASESSAVKSISYKYNSDLVKAKTQDSHGMDYFVYHEADESKNHPLAITDENGLAEITIKIWTEGWDLNSHNGSKAPFTGTLSFSAPGLSSN